MKATTVQKRIEKNLYTKSGKLNRVYEAPIFALLVGTERMRTKRWQRNNSHMRLDDKEHRYLEVLNAIGVDYIVGNDAPNGGKEGDYITLTKKGVRQIKEWRKCASFNGGSITLINQ